jgi:serine protease Do
LLKEGLIMRFLFPIILLLTVILAPAVHAESTDIQAASGSVVRIVVFGNVEGDRGIVGTASGVVIAPGKIITNAHVVEAAVYDDQVTFQIIPSNGGQNYTAQVIKWSPDNDLALLQVEQGAQLKPALLFSTPAADGADVYAIGYPASVDVALQMSESDLMAPTPPIKTRGTISAGRSAKIFDTFLHTAPIGPGNSGGPVVDACGRILGD